MGRKSPRTTRSQIRSALRRLFLRSRERAACIKAAQYTCAKCGAKQSRAKGREVFVEVHHKAGVLNWNQLIDLMYMELLCEPEKMECLCVGCHDEAEKGKNSNHERLPESHEVDEEIL
jgi:hypothetical protein